MKTHLRNLFLLPALIAGTGFLLAIIPIMLVNINRFRAQEATR